MKFALLGAFAVMLSTACGGDGVARSSGASAGRDATGNGGQTIAGEGGSATSSTGGAPSGGAPAAANGGALATGGNSGGVPAGSGGAPGTGGRSGGAPGTAGKPGTGGESSDAGGGSGGAASSGADIARIISEYRTWHPRTDEPVDISSYIFALCRAPTLKEQTFADSEHGKSRKLQDWANDAAVAGMAGDAGMHVFLEGAAIVKEKYVLATDGKLELVARGFMVKQKAGFDPALGDWDYAYWEPDLGIVHTTEQSQYCGGCHIGGGSTDSVFIDGLVP